MNSTHALLGFIAASQSLNTSAAPLPLPSLPPVRRGAPPRPIGQPAPTANLQLEADAACKRANARKATNGYPFMTKSEIKAQLLTDRAFRHDAMLVLFERQTDDEIVSRDTKWKNKRGFMSSHAVHGTRIAELILAGSPISPEDEEKILKIAPAYSKQLASHFQQAAMKSNPALIATAAKFGILPL